MIPVSSSYAPSQVCEAIYGNIQGAQFDSQTGLWSLPCNVEIDIALQFKYGSTTSGTIKLTPFLSDQVFAMHPLDVVPESITDPGNCVGSFVSQDISAIAAGSLYVAFQTALAPSLN